MKTMGSIKVAVDASGNPWLIVGVADGEYEAVQVRVQSRHLFDRSYQAVKYAEQQITPVDDAWKALRTNG